MSNSSFVPIFPLAILPLPGELVPLHIFEPRYKQLLQDAETNDVSFGVYFNHAINTIRLGSLMKLESVVKRYPNGESDIIVKCISIFVLDKLHKAFREKEYPGGEIHRHDIDILQLPGERLYTLFTRYMTYRNITKRLVSFNVFQIANELNLEVTERYRLLTVSDTEREKILFLRLKFLIHILEQEQKSKNVFHLN